MMPTIEKRLLAMKKWKAKTANPSQRMKQRNPLHDFESNRTDISDLREQSLSQEIAAWDEASDEDFERFEDSLGE